MLNMLNLNIDDARTFITVVEAGSVSQAARELHLTQPAVTRRVQRLEQAVGAPLIDRGKRPFVLTDVGQAAIERCRRLVSTTEELKGLAQADALPTRELRIGVAHALTELALFEPVDQMRREFPPVVLRLYTGWSHELLGRVKSEALDAAVILLPQEERLPAGIEGRVLAKEQLLIIAPRSWRSAKATVREIAEAGWILNPEGCAARAWLQRELAHAGMPLRVGVEAYNYELQMALVARGRGLGLVPKRLLAASPARKQLRTLSVRALEFPMTIWTVTRNLAANLKLPLEALDRGLLQRLARRPDPASAHQ